MKFISKSGVLCLIFCSGMANITAFTIAEPIEASLCTTTTILKPTCQSCSTIILGRSTHDNTAYRYLPWQHRNGDCSFDGAFAVGFEYQQTFAANDLARCLFGRPTLSFKGSQVADRNPTNDIIADYFGLSPLFEGTITFHPQIQNSNVHLESFFEFGNCVKGLYLRVDMTFTHQQRSLYNSSCACPAEVDVAGTNTTLFPPGYMGLPITGLYPGTVPAPTIQEGLSGFFAFGDFFSNALIGSGDLRPPWRYGRFNCKALTDNQIAGLSVDLGYDFVRCEDQHIGLFLRYSAPTGTQLNGSQKYAENVFFPIIGNGRHHELGGGLTAHKELWANDCGDALTIYLDGYATHLFKNCQIRSFDFCNRGCLSRYMLLKQIVPFSTAQTPAALNVPFINAINFTTRFVDSTIKVQGDATLRLIYNHCNFSLGLGYNIFGRTRESICLKEKSPCDAIDPNKSYGLKGCLGTNFFTYTQDGSGAIVNDGSQLLTPLSSTATNSATITNCGTTDNPLSTNTGPGNTVGVDWTNVFKGNGDSPASVTNGTPVSSLSIAYLSNPQVALSSDLSTVLAIASGQAARLMTQKGFITLDYMWRDNCFMPYFSMGCEVEGGSRCCDIKQWGLWLKGGFCF